MGHREGRGSGRGAARSVGLPRCRGELGEAGAWIRQAAAVEASGVVEWIRRESLQEVVAAVDREWEVAGVKWANREGRLQDAG